MAWLLLGRRAVGERQLLKNNIGLAAQTSERIPLWKRLGQLHRLDGEIALGGWMLDAGDRGRPTIAEHVAYRAGGVQKQHRLGCAGFERLDHLMQHRLELRVHRRACSLPRALGLNRGFLNAKLGIDKFGSSLVGASFRRSEILLTLSPQTDVSGVEAEV